ncbi:MAG: tetratricopeptide repeat protein, partial [Opitutales bacterium]
MKALSNDLSRALSRPTWAEQIEALERAVASDRDLDAIREVIEGWWSGEGGAEPVGRRPEERLRLAHGTVLAKLGRWGEAAEMLDPLMDPPSAALAPAALAGAYNLRGIVHRHQGHQEQAQVCFREAERLWERTGDAAGLTRAYINQANLHGDRGDYGSAVNLHERALEHVSPEREPNLFARLLLNTAFDHHQLGNHEVSVELLERASAMIQGQEHGTRLAGECAVLLGYVRLSQEAATEAAAHFEEGRRRAVELGNRAILASALTGMGEALAQSGDATRALPFLAEARSILEAIGDQRDLAKLEVAYGEVLHAAGDQAGARASFERGQAMAEATGYIELFERVHRGLAAVAEAEGDAAEALAHLRRALECVRETFAERTRNQLSFLRLRLDSLQERHLQELDEARRTRLEEDNAQLSAANRRLEQLVFERRELLSIVAHDLRSPLASVVTVSEVAETSSDLSAEDLQRFLRELALSSESSLELLDLLLNLERMDASMVSAR